MDSLLQKSL